MQKTLLRNVFVTLLAIAASCLPLQTARGQESLTPAFITSLVHDTVQHQLAEYQHHGWAVQYRVHRVDPREDSIREVIETVDGNVSRTFTHQGRPLTPEEEQGELERLRLLKPEEVRRRRDRSDSDDKYGLELIRSLPQAMLFTPTPAQPQPAGYAAKQIVLDYTPNPAFHPSSTVQSLLTGLSGRVWIDAETHHLSRIEIHIVKNLNLMFGMLARVYEGGSLSYEQKPAGGGHDVFTQIEMNVKLRELMVRVAPYRQTFTATNLRYLPIVPSMKDAVNSLLAMPALTQ